MPSFHCFAPRVLTRVAITTKTAFSIAAVLVATIVPTSLICAQPSKPESSVAISASSSPLSSSGGSSANPAPLRRAALSQAGSSEYAGTVRSQNSLAASSSSLVSVSSSTGASPSFASSSPASMPQSAGFQSVSSISNAGTATGVPSNHSESRADPVDQAASAALPITGAEPQAELLSDDQGASLVSPSKFILDTEVKPKSSMRLTWNSDAAVGAFSEATPVLVVNGANPGKTLCLVAAIHGDELNGIEMIRRVIFDIDPAKLTGTIIGVPVANIMGFRRNSRYLPDRRDWNRYFPGNTHGSSASRLAHSFFSKIIMHCDALVDLHTGSFHRTNLPQLRADLGDEKVAALAQNFGVIAVLNSRGNPNSLRAAAVRAGIPSVTLEAGEPMAMQSDVVEEGVTAINTLLAKTGMYGKKQRWSRIAPVYYRSVWVRANQSGILFSKATLGQRVTEGEVLGTVTDPVTNARATIKSPYQGRIIGMALDQVVLPGFAAYHIGIQTPEAILIEESQMNQLEPDEDDEDGDDSGIEASEEVGSPDADAS